VEARLEDEDDDEYEDVAPPANTPVSFLAMFFLTAR
jgi:hypothetical protein